MTRRQNMLVVCSSLPVLTNQNLSYAQMKEHYFGLKDHLDSLWLKKVVVHCRFFTFFYLNLLAFSDVGLARMTHYTLDVYFYFKRDFLIHI